MHLPLSHPAHPPVQNINELLEERLSFGQRAADWIAGRVGSWGFIIGQSGLLVLWAVLNALPSVRHWDPYPFIAMNLLLSLQAAYTAPMIMMSQSRQVLRDRLEAHEDYVVNCKAESELIVVLRHLEAQNEVMADLTSQLERLGRRLDLLEGPAELPRESL
ncbi:DUF1003 domain-containing protein [Deinococcus sp.]|uniref:DUF1003 domain-containing protein n=1 Tax=Deinococcus sp. TaxID=47478 RepID=UPI0025DFE80E|nr:DUF1003 domain-containing protein [Deinococcus sp.]